MMTKGQRDRTVATLKAAIEALEAAPVATPCHECLHFENKFGRCSQWNADVPEAAQAAGCHRWEEAIPF